MAKRTEALVTGSLSLKPQGAFVYRVYDWAGRLVYIGMTSDLCRRMSTHRADSFWWPNAAQIEWEEYGERDAAARRESQLIAELDPPQNTHFRRRALRPLHNIDGNDGELIPLPPADENQLPDEIRDRLFMERVRTMQAKRESV